ncbi:MAG: SDR family oxidoreductase [Alphaproteobacteria bacterium]|nr:SDR family oxidoreductase [Alphaproteobacteria bacterium]
MTAPIALVTAGSRGIGATTARMLAEAGYDVAISYLSNEAAATTVVDEIRAAGQRGLAVAADNADEADILRLFETVDRELGTLTALVNNAGITGGFARVEAVTAETLQQVAAVNFIGPMLCCREAVRRMSTKHGGTGGAIVNVSSTAATRGSAGEWVHYAATKGAMNTMTVGLAAEVAGEGIRVNAVAPGLTATELHAESGEPGRIDRISPLIPLGRAGEPEEMAAAIRWLLSDEASFTIGAIVPVSGGF